MPNPARGRRAARAAQHVHTPRPIVRHRLAAQILGALLLSLVVGDREPPAFAQRNPPDAPPAQQFALHFAPSDQRLYRLHVRSGQSPSTGHGQVGETDATVRWTLGALQDDGSVMIETQVEEASYSVDGRPVDAQTPAGPDTTFTLHMDGSFNNTSNEQAPVN